MTHCAIIIVDTGPLKTLAYAESLNLLLAPKIPVHISDMVVEELKFRAEFEGNRLALEFLQIHESKIEIISTGVVPIADQLKALGVDPGDESIRRVIHRYEDEMQGEFALLVSEDDKFMRTADPYGQTYMMTTRPFLKAMQTKGFICDAESLMILAETNAIAAGDLPGRGQLTRKREWNLAPRRNPSIKPF